MYQNVINRSNLLLSSLQSSTYYQNCACVMSKADPIGKVEKGLCQVDCGLSLVLLLIVLSAIALLTFLNDTPAIVVTLRYWFQTFHIFVCSCYSYTVAPRYNEDPVKTNDIWKPGRITVKYVEANPAITSWFWRCQRTIYPAITNILSCRSQSVKTTWWYKWLVSQTRLPLVKIGKRWPSKLCFI